MSGTRKLLGVFITAFALLALGVSSYLTWVTWQQSTVAGCTGGSLADCDEVLASSGSKWLGVPVSLLGALTYVGIIALVWPAVLRGGWLMTAFLTLTMMAAGAGVWFIISQAFIVKHFCMYCMTVHVCGLLICTLTVLLLRATPQGASYDHMRSFFAVDETVPSEPQGISPLQPVIAAGIASVGLAALIGGQMFFAPSGMEVVDDSSLPVFDDAVVEDQSPTVTDELPSGEIAQQVSPETGAAELTETGEIGGLLVAETTDAAELLEEPSTDAAEDITYETSESIASLGEPTAEELFVPGTEETSEAAAEKQTPQGDEIAEPDGEPVFASDEPETKALAVDKVEVEDPIAAPQVSDVATETTTKSFEELFGEEPLQLQPTGESATIDPDPLVAQASGSSAKSGAADVPQVFRFKYLRGEIDAGNNPVLGNPYAQRRLVEMIDYTCPHCRRLNPFVKAAVDRYGDQLGIVVYHVPLSRKCNQFVKMDQVSHANACEYAKLAYGVWKLKPEKFGEFHEWLMTGDRAPAVHLAKSKAVDLAGFEVLTDKEIDYEFSERIGAHAADLEPLNVGLPVLIFDAGVIRGLPSSEGEWFQTLEQRLGLTPSLARAGN